MNQLLLDYLPLAVFLGVALLIGGALMLAPFWWPCATPTREGVGLRVRL
jgi:NADH-quinone oxidoreductase subunit A